MDTTYCPIILKKKLPDCTSNKKRSKSAPRGCESLYERTLNYFQNRENKNNILRLQIEKEKSKNQEPLYPMNRYVFHTPEIKNSYWDNKGYLLKKDFITKDGKVLSDQRIKSKMSYHSKELIEKNKSDHIPITQRIEVKNRAVSECTHKRRKNSKDFLKRQDQSYNSRQKVIKSGLRKEERLRNQPHMNSNSKYLCRKGITLSPRKIYVEEEFSFIPDTSLTKNNNVHGLSCRFSEAQTVLRDIEVTGIKVELEAQELKDCTFEPNRPSSEKSYQLIKMRAKQNNEKKQDKYQKLVQDIEKKEKDDNTYIHHQTEIPKITHYLHELLHDFSPPPQKNNQKKNNKNVNNNK